MPHFMITFIPFINLLNLSWIIKCLFFEEYEALGTKESTSETQRWKCLNTAKETSNCRTCVSLQNGGKHFEVYTFPLAFYPNIIRAASSEYAPSNMHKFCRFRSACVCAKYHIY